MIDFRLSFSNYRSFADPVSLLFDRRITFVVGPNNAGKSNVLRFLAILLNKANNELNDTLDFYREPKEVSVTISLSRTFFERTFAKMPRLMTAIRSSKAQFAPLSVKITKTDVVVGNNPPEAFFNLIPQQYFTHSGSFSDDFRSSGGLEYNMNLFLKRIDLTSHFAGTTYVPNVRFITTVGQEPPMFSNVKFPGTTIAFGKAVDQLAQMDRPSFENLELGDRLRRICEFMQFVLEKREIAVQVASDRKSIIVKIDGVSRPLSSLGTGVEQSLIIGLASFGFPGKLVLIDEPELHLHPRAQKRVMTYLSAVEDSRFVIATHSAACLDAVDADVLHVFENGGGSASVSVTGNLERFRAVRDLGHSPSELIQTRFAIWVEGPSDRVYINHWIQAVEPEFKEGIDYSVLFYGGRILSHHGFDDVEADLVRAVSLSRNFAVVIDSDRKTATDEINDTKVRVQNEVERQGGFCWITEGREIENYLSASTLKAMSAEFTVKPKSGNYGRVIDAATVNKVEFARKAVGVEIADWPLDLKDRVTELANRIKAAR